VAFSGAMAVVQVVVDAAGSEVVAVDEPAQGGK